MALRVRLAYGKDGLEVALPDEARVLAPPRAPALQGLNAVVQAALARPLGTPPLAELARGRREAVLVVPDVTRPLPCAVLLHPVLRTLEAAGIPCEGIRILVATGLHRPNLGEELISLLGEYVAGTYAAASHRAAEAATHRAVGATPRGTPVALDVRYLEAEFKLAFALVEPHLFAGYSGGRKMVVPGIAAAETIHAVHRPELLRSPRARPGCLDGNPLHEELLCAARLAPPDFTVNVTLAADRRVATVHAGELVAAHEAACRAAEAASLATLPVPASVVVTTSAGWPLDLTLYQAVKGLTAAEAILRPGGAFVLAAECAEGRGSAAFVAELLRLGELGPAAYLAELAARGEVRDDQWQTQMLAHALEKGRVYLKSDGLAADELAGTPFVPVASVEEGIARAQSELGEPAAPVAVLPDGPYTLARVEEK